MNKKRSKTGWLLGLLLAFAFVAVAGAALQESLYVPLVLNVYPATATPTIVPGIYINTINFDPPGNPMDEYVVIQNYLNQRVDLTEWTVVNEKSISCTIGGTSPSGRYTLLDDAVLYLWTKDGFPEVGTGDHDNLYCGFTEPWWKDLGDRARLKNQDGDVVDDFAYGSLSRLALPATVTTPIPPTPSPTPTVP